MIVKKEFIDKLKELGLNSYEAKLWTALLSRGVSTAGELSDISNVPRSRAYDVLESLEKKGFIIVKVGKPIKYLAVPPKEVLERVKKKVREEASRKAGHLENLKESEILDELNSLHSEGVELIDPSDKSGAFRGRGKLYDHISLMIKEAKDNITVMTTADGLTRKVSEFKQDLEKASKKGVNVRVAAEIDGANKSKADELNEFAEVRNTDERARFVIVDGKEMLLMLMDSNDVHENYDSGIWFETPFFISHFKNLFDEKWEKMEGINS